MGKKRPERTARRQAERDARKLVRDRETLARLEIGGSRARPIEVPAASVIEGRARGARCPQCGGGYRIDDEQAPAPQIRLVTVTCQLCGVSRGLYFRIVASGPN
jgi:hypothetical protein